MSDDKRQAATARSAAAERGDERQVGARKDGRGYATRADDPSATTASEQATTAQQQ